MGIFVMKNKTFHKKKILVVFLAAFILILYLIGRLVYLMVFDAEYYPVSYTHLTLPTTSRV